MLNKLKKILQWFVSVCFILSGLIYVGEYTVPAIVLMELAGVIVLPPVTKKIPAFKFRKAILIITSMVLLSAGMITGENNLSPEVQAKRAAAAEAAASSKAVMEAQKAAESASHAAKETEEAASKKAQEEADAASKAAEMAASKAAVAAEAESTANKKREEANEKIKEYKELIESTLKSSSNYANTDSSNKKAFKKIAADKDSIATFTMAWRQYLKTHMNNARVNGNLDKSQMYFFENMIKLYQNFLPDEMSNISKENDLYTQYKKDEKAYRTQFNNFFRGFVDPTYEIPEVSCGWITIHNKMGTVYSSTINGYAAKIQNYANGTSNHESWYGSIYVDANGGYREYVVVETDGTLSFPEQGDYDLIYLNTGKTAGVQDSKGFEKDVPLYYLLGDYDSDYDKYTDLEGAAEAMKEYPHEVYLMTIDTGYAA